MAMSKTSIWLSIQRVIRSRARGDARADSDYDLAVFLKQLPDLIDETVALFDVLPYPGLRERAQDEELSHATLSRRSFILSGSVNH